MNTNALRKPAVWLLFLTVFIIHSRLFDMLAPGLHLPLVLLAALGVLFLLIRNWFSFWKNSAGKILIAWAVWLLISAFLGVSRNESMEPLHSAAVGIGLFIVVAGILIAADDFEKLYLVLGASGFVAATLGLVWARQISGRIALRAGNYADPNAYAAGLLMTLPFLGTVAARTQKTWLKILYGLANLLPFLIMLKTGSRGALAGLLVGIVVLFILSSLTLRIVLASALILAAVGVLAFMPDAVRTRFLPDSTENQTLAQQRQSEDRQSVEARQTLFFTSIAMTLNNPVFGVGPGNFPNVVAEEGRERGEDWAHLSTHNSYTQASSETGIPGAILFLSLVGVSLFNVISTLRDTRPTGPVPNAQVYQLARGLLLSMAALFTAYMFLNQAYAAIGYLWMGLAVALRQLVPRPVVENEEQEPEETAA